MRFSARSSPEDRDRILLYRPGRNGEAEVEGLCVMDGHDYLRRLPVDRNLEPTVHVTPDGNWVAFRANFFGTPQVYLVDARPR